MPAPRYASPLPPEPPKPRIRLGRVQDLLAEHPGLTEPAVRAYIFRAKENGLERHLYRKGRRVWFDLDGFQRWVSEDE
ncbi:MAG: hypothetical protein WAK53_17680 [Chromatiaceae bacterium]|jgi:hypothetical protein